MKSVRLSGYVLSVFLIINLPLQESLFAKSEVNYWPEYKIREVLDNSMEIYFSPDIKHLSTAELETLKHLQIAGEQLHKIYLNAQHKQALFIKQQLLHKKQEGEKKAQVLLDLFRLFKGPIATTLSNERKAFAPVESEVAGKNRYPWNISKDEIDTFLKIYPEEKTSILHTRSVVKRNTERNLKIDLKNLDKFPVLATLHPEFKPMLAKLAEDKNRTLYAVPYSIVNADRTMKAYEALWKASTSIRSTDLDFSDYLRNRARDLLSDNYESGDASWLTGRFGNINAQIGSYETYDDNLYGVKAASSMSILIKDQKRSKDLAKAMQGIQELENRLPHINHKTVKADIPIGVYNVYLDYGQARGTNTATILPNESHIVKKYGRIILLRYDVLTNPKIFATNKSVWNAVMADNYDADLTIESNFQRTLWHEVGHYLGPTLDKTGRTLDVALENNSNLIEEMKADLSSLYTASYLQEKGLLTKDELKHFYASGIRRTFRNVKPRRTQAYNTMQLMTMNYFLEQGVLKFDKNTREIHINYLIYPKVVKDLLAVLLDIQYQGDKLAADKFIDRYSVWNENIHGVLAKKMLDTKQPRYRIVRYSALGE